MMQKKQKAEKDGRQFKAELLIDAEHRIAHNKVMVIDGQTVIAGSFNFTKSAETRDAENLLVIRSPELAIKDANWRLFSQ
jgi:phosphatidylserine/phosphatidylglycerophosphate/cardiolipin synthase-like enzyme